VSTLMVVPVIDPGISAACLETIHPDVDLFVVDNCPSPLGWSTSKGVFRMGHNLGVARSWNLAVRTAGMWDYDAVALVSASVRFGEAGGRDLVTLDPGKWGVTPLPAAWHTVVLTMGLFERVGFFDENFFPAYYEDADMTRRMSMAGIHLGVGDVVIDLVCGPPGHGVDALRHQHPGISAVNYIALAEYWAAKWDVPVKEAADVSRGHVTPFGLDVDLSWWEPVEVDELLKRYGIAGR
jgi:hypothetical protein